VAFRAQLAADLAGVFLNLEEFGEALVIDGVSLTAVRDDDLSTERTKGPPQPDALWADRTVLHLSADAMTRPVEGQRLVVDGDGWFVLQTSEAEGALELTLQRQEA